MRASRTVTAVYLIFLVLPIGCSERATEHASPVAPSVSNIGVQALTPVARVSITPPAVTMARTTTTTLIATAYDSADNVVTGRPTKWSTPNPQIVKVASSGVVTALRQGTATIVARIGGKIGTATVTVVAVQTASVTVSPTTVSLTSGATQQLVAVVKDAAGNVLARPVTWTTTAATVATVSSTGLVTAVAAGSASILATNDGVSGSASITVTSSQPSSRWLSGYYVGYQRNLYPETSIDFSLLTHIFVGAIEPTPSGGVTTDFWIDPINGPIMAQTISTRAHQAGRKAVLMLGGAGYRNALLAATSATTIATFVNNLVSTMNSLGYDGIDVDWEPILTSDQPVLLDLLNRLRAAKPNIILSVPVTWVNSNFPTVDPWYSQVAAVVDQINLMSYGMADNWGGWQSWHHAALFGESPSHPSSVSSSARAYLLAGVPAQKLGIGLAFYGSCWQGTNTMGQTLSPTAHVVASDNTMSYTNIMGQYYSAGAYRWDATARAGYLSFGAGTGPQQCTLVSYEDAQSIAEKGSYVKSQGLGGAIIWTIGQGHIPSAPVGQRDPLLTAAYNAIVP